MSEKLGQKPAFANEYHNGISTRLYIANNYADIAYKWACDMSEIGMKETIYLPISTKWNYFVHFPMLIAKLQFMLADELLKQDQNG